jgi:hypothetical protein
MVHPFYFYLSTRMSPSTISDISVHKINSLVESNIVI